MNNPPGESVSDSDRSASAYCRLCGHDNESDARFCSACGAHLAADLEAVTQTLTPLAPDPNAGGPAVELVVVSGHRAGTRFAVESQLVSIGRHPDSDVFLDDITVSRKHVELLEGAAGYAIRDTGSLNGTYVNGTRIDGEQALTSGDELQVGKFRLLYIVSSVGL